LNPVRAATNQIAADQGRLFWILSELSVLPSHDLPFPSFETAVPPGGTTSTERAPFEQAEDGDGPSATISAGQPDQA
jgi:hypothetical protein